MLRYFKSPQFAWHLTWVWAWLQASFCLVAVAWPAAGRYFTPRTWLPALIASGYAWPVGVLSWIFLAALFVPHWQTPRWLKVVGAGLSIVGILLMTFVHVPSGMAFVFSGIGLREKARQAAGDTVVVPRQPV